MFKVISQEKMLESNGGDGYMVHAYVHDNRGFLCRVDDVEVPWSFLQDPYSAPVVVIDGKYKCKYDKYYGPNGYK